MKNSTTIKCPNCNTDIDVNDILYHQLEDELKQKNITEQKKLKDEADKKAQEDLETQQEAIKEQRDKFYEKSKPIQKLNNNNELGKYSNYNLLRITNPNNGIYKEIRLLGWLDCDIEKMINRYRSAEYTLDLIKKRY
jgi:hypothetical protein